jgi:hypothetical protein
MQQGHISKLSFRRNNTVKDLHKVHKVVYEAILKYVDIAQNERFLDCIT